MSLQQQVVVSHPLSFQFSSVAFFGSLVCARAHGSTHDASTTVHKRVRMVLSSDLNRNCWMTTDRFSDERNGKHVPAIMSSHPQHSHCPDDGDAGWEDRVPGRASIHTASPTVPIPTRARRTKISA